MRKRNQKLQLKSENIRTLEMNELVIVAAGDGFQTEKESIVYWCPNNTSIQRSCSSCN